MRKLQRRVDGIDRRVRLLRQDVDTIVTAEDRAAMKEAEKDLKSGKTVRIA